MSGRLSLSTEQGQNFTAAKETISRQETASKAPECAGSSTVHYYWGVPFCPRGLDPDSYTRVKICKIKGASVIIQVHLFTEKFLLFLCFSGDPGSDGGLREESETGAEGSAKKS